MASLVLNGNTSGSVTISSPAVSGTTTLTLPATTGTVVTKDTNGILSVNGVQFPATQSPSADANCLDDYEEGTWTPTITAVTGSYTTVTSQTGKYTKIGNKVTINGFFIVSSKGTGSAGASIANLPFSSNGDRFPGDGFNTSSGICYSLYFTSASFFELYTYAGADPIIATQGNVFQVTYFI